MQAATERDGLQVARPQIPAVEAAVAAAVVEERVDGRLGPHPMEHVDYPLGAAAGAEVLVCERELHRAP